MSSYPLAFAVHVFDSLFQNPISLFDAKKMSNDELSDFWQTRHERGLYITYLTHKNPTKCSFGLTEIVNGLAGGHNP